MNEHKCINEKELERLAEENAELRKVASNHVSWAIFWSVTVLLASVFGTIMNVNYEKITELEKSNNDSKITSTRIETQLSQIQTDIMDIKLSLKDHDKVKR